ncbi:hypothetical protein CRM83_06180 [Escherichia coli]|nr:hypothetical protein CEQ26_08175 [Escherichia coli O104:H4]ATG05746.1 hypothetical protein CO703_08885 [Escherichia coli]ATG10149.1 hypothetical protein CO706_04265 [Escherichia coli]AVL29317.1 hypothetical protein CEQ27_03095 [Escherichia coli O104:H4]EAA0637630.1 hypothetical protein [Escherichia coli]
MFDSGPFPTSGLQVHLPAISRKAPAHNLRFLPCTGNKKPAITAGYDMLSGITQNFRPMPANKPSVFQSPEPELS